MPQTTTEPRTGREMAEALEALGGKQVSPLSTGAWTTYVRFAGMVNTVGAALVSDASPSSPTGWSYVVRHFITGTVTRDAVRYDWPAVLAFLGLSPEN